MKAETSIASIPSDKVPFTLDEPEFDMNTYYGRFRSFQKTCDPRIAFFTNGRINELRRLLDD